MDIPKEYIKNGLKWELRQLKDNVGIYFNKDSKSFEVIIIRPNPNYLKEKNIKGKRIIFNNSFIIPTNEEFGTFGWSFFSKTNAENKFKELTTQETPIFNLLGYGKF
jgi:hypothetical protein